MPIGEWLALATLAGRIKSIFAHKRKEIIQAEAGKARAKAHEFDAESLNVMVKAANTGSSPAERPGGMDLMPISYDAPGSPVQIPQVLAESEFYKQGRDLRGMYKRRERKKLLDQGSIYQLAIETQEIRHGPDDDYSWRRREIVTVPKGQPLSSEAQDIWNSMLGEVPEAHDQQEPPA